MSAALPHISLRRLNICFFVCLQSFILFSCIILFPPKSFFPAWMILVSFILEAFLQSQVTLGCPFILNTKIHKSDLRVYFAGLFCGVDRACSWWISLTEKGSEPAFSGWDPRWHSLQVFSLQPLSSPRAEPPHSCWTERWCLAASRGRGWVAELPPFNDCQCWLLLSPWYYPKPHCPPLCTR